MEDMHPAHQTNATAKAWRAIKAIETLATTVLVPGDDWPEIETEADALRYLLDVLFAIPLGREGAALWVAVGVIYDMKKGKSTYQVGPGGRVEGPTQFVTSRQTVYDMLDAKVWALDHPAPADPFEGLGFDNNGGAPAANPF